MNLGPKRTEEGLGQHASRHLRLGELLIQRGLITHEQLESALKRQQQSQPRQQLGQILVEDGHVTPDHVVAALAELVTVPFCRLSPEIIEPDVLTRLPQGFLEAHNLLPLSMHDNVLTIAVEQFTNVFLIEEIRRAAGCEIMVVAATPGNIRETRRTLFRSMLPSSPEPRESNDGLQELLNEIGVDDLKVVEQERNEIADDLVAEAAGSPVVKLVNYVIKTAVSAGASDIHIEPDSASFRVRFRVDGELKDVVRPIARLLPAVVSRIKIMAGMDISERRLPQDGGMTVTLADRPIDIRVSTMTTKYGEKVVMRVIDRETRVRTLEDLGVEPAMLRSLRTMISQPTGMVLITGPTGSGKTTTAYALLSEVTSERWNISTIEDPIERRLAGTNQFQIAPSAGFTFAKALRSLLRQDPDIIMVGEIRDSETAKLAAEAALTGHLVFSTLHTNDAPTAIPRLVNMGVEPYLIAASLRGVLAQRLVRQICAHCRAPAVITAAEREAMAIAAGNAVQQFTGYAGKGCDACRHAGYLGRIGVFELLECGEESLAPIVRDPSISHVRDLARQSGFTSLAQDGLDKIRRGVISVRELLSTVSIDMTGECVSPIDSCGERNIAA